MASYWNISKSECRRNSRLIEQDKENTTCIYIEDPFKRGNFDVNGRSERMKERTKEWEKKEKRKKGK